MRSESLSSRTPPWSCRSLWMHGTSWNPNQNNDLYFWRLSQPLTTRPLKTKRRFMKGFHLCIAGQGYRRKRLCIHFCFCIWSEDACYLPKSRTNPTCLSWIKTHTQNMMSLSFILVCVLNAHSTSNRFFIFSHQSQLKGDPVSFFHQFYMLAFTSVVFMCQWYQNSWLDSSIGTGNEYCTVIANRCEYLERIRVSPKVKQ